MNLKVGAGVAGGAAEKVLDPAPPKLKLGVPAPKAEVAGVAAEPKLNEGVGAVEG